MRGAANLTAPSIRGVADSTARSILRSVAGLVILSMASCTADSSPDSGTMAGSTAEAQPDPEAIRPFTIDIPEDVLTDLRDRLSRTRLPEQSPGTGWEQGANRAVRSSAAEALAKLGATEAIPALERALADPEESVRRRAEYALRDLRRESR